MARVKQVKDFRNASGREVTRKLASYPTLFGERRQPTSDYLLLPKVSSENRDYMPIGFIKPSFIANGSALIVPNATKYHFGVLQSSMHMAWMRTVCGRMKSDYQYSAGIVYNNFPWPEASEKHQTAVETAAQSVLDARAKHPEATLADLYDPLATPPNLSKAHAQLDKAVDAAYGYKPVLSKVEGPVLSKVEGAALSRAEGSGKDDAARVAFLFERYLALLES
jgi:hypothetical protein